MKNETKLTDETANIGKVVLGDALFKKFNINYPVFVKLTDRGITHYVTECNKIMPFEMQISFREFKNRADKNGFHEFQLWSFIDNFGGAGMRVCDYCSTEVLFKECDLKSIA